MAKTPKNAEKFPIQWNGIVVGGGNQGDEIPTNIDIRWGGYIPCWDKLGTTVYGDYTTYAWNDCGDPEDLYFEDIDIDVDEVIVVADGLIWNNNGRADVYQFIITKILGDGTDTIPKAPKTTFTWGDVNFIQEIVDGLGTGRRRQDRLNKILDDEDKKKRIIHLICRVKGEKVFDEDIEVKDVQVNIKDVDMITERILGKVTMETEDVL